MKILLVSPKYPDTFWSFKYALRFTPDKKTTHPPLGLLTVAAMFPEEWEKKLVDLNISGLKDSDLLWADYVFISAMHIQKASVDEIIARCRDADVKIVAGGTYFTTSGDEFEEVDHLILNEAEITFPPFLDDLKNGRAKRVYRSDRFADLRTTPVPAWELVDMRKYVSMSVQFSRGCPFDCDFCDITKLYGRSPRTKTKEQVIAELEYLYEQGWRAGVFFVDDNFIANRRELKNELLPAVIEWMEEKGRPFSFVTQASIDLSDDEELMRSMAETGFDGVFVGIETPSEEGLSECNKFPNKNRDLIASVKKIRKFGLQVQGGFIVGFDSDSPSIFDSQIKFIQESGIVVAMVGLLNASRGTKLYNQMERENRLVDDSTGDNTDFSTNIIPKMPYKTLIDGYKYLVKTIYSPDYYYERVTGFLRDFMPMYKNKGRRISWSYIKAFIKSMFILGIIGRERVYYWKLFFETVFARPRLLSLAITFAIYGYHFRKVFEVY